MNRYILTVVSFWISCLSASTLDSAAVDISYTYCNDPASQAAGLVPVRVLCDADAPFTVCTFNVCFFGRTRTVEEILYTVIDRFELNEFATFRLWSGSEEIVDNPIFTMEELGRMGSLTIDYDIQENTPEAIKHRRIQWLVDQLTESHQEAWGNREQRERVRALVEKNHVDALGKHLSLRELCEIVENGELTCERYMPESELGSETS
jgi:hypothetical protein